VLGEGRRSLREGIGRLEEGITDEFYKFAGFEPNL
jgi:hypothetical protein